MSVAILRVRFYGIVILYRCLYMFFEAWMLLHLPQLVAVVYCCCCCLEKLTNL